MAAWRNLRDPYRKKILNPGKGGGRGGGDAGGKKSGSKGSSVAEQQEHWKFYEKMSTHNFKWMSIKKWNVTLQD